MQVSVENTSLIGRRLTVTIPSEQVKSEVQQKINEIARHRRINGFRPGKMPKTLVNQKFGPEIHHDAVSRIIENSLPLVLKQESLNPAGRPEIIEIKNFNERDKDLTYIVDLEVFPEVTVPDFSTFKVKKYQVDISDQEVDKMLENLQDQLANWVPVDRSAKLKDRLTIDYVSLLNGKPYENSSNQDILVELGSNAFIEGFEQGLLGVSAGEKRELDVHFPSDWRFEKLAGKPVHFTVQVKSVSEKQPAELNEEFAKKIGADNAELPSIRKKIQENLEKQSQQLVLEHLKKSVLDKLLEVNNVMLPKALVQNEMALLHEDLHRQMGNKAVDSCRHEGLEAQAKERVALSLILGEIVKLEKLTPDAEKVREKIAAMTKSFGNAEFIEKMYYESKELLSGIQNSVLVDQVIDLVLSKASIIKEARSFEALVRGNIKE